MPGRESEVTDHARDDYRDGPNGAPDLEYNQRAPELVRRIVADPDDESAWLAYSDDLADHGHDADALIVRMLWPALRDSLLTLRSFDAVMADVRRNRTLLHALAAGQATDPHDNDRDDPDPARTWSIERTILIALAVTVLVICMGIAVLTLLGSK
jgi:uncharacterized protein (TIGR02996 family)